MGVMLSATLRAGCLMARSHLPTSHFLSLRRSTTSLTMSVRALVTVLAVAGVPLSSDGLELISILHSGVSWRGVAWGSGGEAEEAEEAEVARHEPFHSGQRRPTACCWVCSAAPTRQRWALRGVGAP